MKRGVIVALLCLAACGSPSSPSGTSDPGGGGLVPAQFQSITRGAFSGPVEFSRNGLTASCPTGSVSFNLTNR